MVRNYRRKKETPPPREEVLREAIYAVLVLSTSIRVAAKEYGLCKSTLGDYVKKIKNQGSGIPDFVKRQKFQRQVYPCELESLLCDYLKLKRNLRENLKLINF